MDSCGCGKLLSGCSYGCSCSFYDGDEGKALTVVMAVALIMAKPVDVECASEGVINALIVTKSAAKSMTVK